MERSYVRTVEEAYRPGWKETIDLWLCRLSGLPVSESWGLPPGPPTLGQIAVTGSLVCGHAVLAALYAVDSITSEGLSALQTYQLLFFVIRPAAYAFTVFHMASGDRSAPKRLAVRVNRVRESMITHGLGVAATDVCRLASNFLLAATLLSICVSKIRLVIDVFFFQYERFLFESHPVRFVLATVLSPPSTVLLRMILYRSAAQPLAELGIIEDLIRELTPTGPEHEPDAEPGPDAAPEEDPRPRPHPLTVHRCRVLIALCDQANKLRLESNRWLHAPASVAMFCVAWTLPFIFLGMVEVSEFSFYASVSNIVFLIIGPIVQLMPLCFAQLVKYRRSYLVQKAAREADRTEDPELRRALTKLKINAEEMFPDSPCVLVDFDLSLLPVLLNVALLALTTFFQQEST